MRLTGGNYATVVVCYTAQRFPFLYNQFLSQPKQWPKIPVFLGDRVIFKVLNKGILTEDHFRKDVNYCLLNEEGKKLFLKHFDERMKTTVKHRSLRRNVSYRRLIRLECYKLIKHFLGVQEYKAFRMWW